MELNLHPIFLDQSNILRSKSTITTKEDQKKRFTSSNICDLKNHRCSHRANVLIKGVT